MSDCDIVGKRDKMRTVPMSSLTEATIDSWTCAARIESGFIFRRVNKGGNMMGEGFTEQTIYNIIVGYAEKVEKQGIAPHGMGSTFAKLAQGRFAD